MSDAKPQEPKEPIVQVNGTQLQVGGASIIALLAGFAAGKNWFNLSVSDWTTILTAMAAIGGVIGPLIVTTAKRLKNTVGNLPRTTVVTDKASADALPDNPDVVAATPEITAAIKKAS